MGLMPNGLAAGCNLGLLACFFGALSPRPLAAKGSSGTFNARGLPAPTRDRLRAASLSCGAWKGGMDCGADGGWWVFTWWRQSESLEASVCLSLPPTEMV